MVAVTTGASATDAAATDIAAEVAALREHEDTSGIDKSVCAADVVEGAMRASSGTGSGDAIGQVRSAWHMVSHTRTDRAGETALA